MSKNSDGLPYDFAQFLIENDAYQAFLHDQGSGIHEMSYIKPGADFGDIIDLCIRWSLGGNVKDPGFWKDLYIRGRGRRVAEYISFAEVNKDGIEIGYE